MLQDWGDKNVLKSMVAVNTADINGELYEMRIKSQSCKGGDRKVRSRPRGRGGTWIVRPQRSQETPGERGLGEGQWGVPCCSGVNSMKPASWPMTMAGWRRLGEASGPTQDCRQEEMNEVSQSQSIGCCLKMCLQNEKEVFQGHWTLLRLGDPGVLRRRLCPRMAE